MIFIIGYIDNCHIKCKTTVVCCVWDGQLYKCGNCMIDSTVFRFDEIS